MQNKPVLTIDLTLRLMRDLIEVPASPSPERLLEIVLVDTADTSEMPAPATQNIPIPSQQEKIVEKPAETPKAAVVSKPVSKLAPKAVSKPESTPEKTKDPEAATQPEASSGPSVQRTLDLAVWPEIVNGIKSQYNTLYGVLRMANPVFGENEVELQFKFAFHQKRLNEVKNRKIIADCIKRVTGRSVAVHCTVNTDAEPLVATVATPNAGAVAAAAPAGLNSITDIFGGGEVLNS